MNTETEYEYEELTPDQVRAMIDEKKGTVDLWAWDSNPYDGDSRRIIAVAYGLTFPFISINSRYAHAGIRRAKSQKWEPPKGAGRLAIGGAGYLAIGHATMIADGRHWPTEEKARLAHERNVFRQRLDRLAEDLQGSVGGVYGVVYIRGEWVVIGGKGTPDGIFKSTTLAQRAAEIMNRDGWKMPAGLGGVQ